MFDLRYHLASLAAVFLALAIGILLGVAISDEGLVSRAEQSLLQRQVDELGDELSEERARSEVSSERREAAEALIERAYPLLMEGRLEGLGFALVFLGAVDGDIRSAVERTLADAGADAPVRMVALDVPLDPGELAALLASSDDLAAYAEAGGDFGELGEALGRELVEGGETPLWTALSGQLVHERSGSAALAVDGAVVAYSWDPGPADGADEVERDEATRSLIEGLLRGVAEAGLPTVGVETTTSPRSDVDVYRQEGISSVDNVDTLTGRVALALVLAGGRPGHYGVKDSATDGVAPALPPATAETDGA